MDEAEKWLQQNDPEFDAVKRKKIDYPYLRQRQMDERVGASNYPGKEIPLSNLDMFKDELGHSDRNQQRRRKIQNIRDQML